MIRAAALLVLTATAAGAVETQNGTHAVLRAIDKISGTVEDIEVDTGASGTYGRMTVSVAECRYPTANPSGDAFAYVTIDVEGSGEHAFQGWMIASAPALNALDHPRYDVWLLRCTTS